MTTLPIQIQPSRDYLRSFRGWLPDDAREAAAQGDHLAEALVAAHEDYQRLRTIQQWREFVALRHQWTGE